MFLSMLETDLTCKSRFISRIFSTCFAVSVGANEVTFAATDALSIALRDLLSAATSAVGVAASASFLTSR